MFFIVVIGFYVFMAVILVVVSRIARTKRK
jgi:hypothetical protein